MKLIDIYFELYKTKKLEKESICKTENNSLEEDVTYGFSSDFMDDVITLENEDTVLITGLNNTEAIKAAKMAGLRCIILARNKDISEEMRFLALDLNIIIIKSKYSVFKTSAELFNKGLKPLF